MFTDFTALRKYKGVNMTEQNWATEEAYLWLANDEDAHAEIMSYPQEQRRYPIQDILDDWVGRGAMGNFTEGDFKQVNLDALAADFADPPEDERSPRYNHDCNWCTFLGRSDEYDVYHHDETDLEQVFLHNPDHDSILLTIPQANAVYNALDMVTEHIKEIGND